MSITVCGLNHKTAPLSLREQCVVTTERLPVILQSLGEQIGSQEAMLLSTCNRLEIYGFQSCENKMSQWLANHFGMEQTNLQPHLYCYQDDAAIQHILRVACGVDSMIVGESQVLGQLKAAYNTAVQVDTINKQLSNVFPFVFSAAKKIRTETSIGQFPVSVAYAAISLAKTVVSDLSKARVLLIGAGDMMELAAKYLSEGGVREIIVANRTLERAQELAKTFSGIPITIGNIPKYLPNVDIVFSSTASQLPIIGKGLMERVLKQRKQKPIFMVDLAVPRDVEPEVGQIPGVHLYNIDDLENVIKENQQDRLSAAQQAETMIAEQVTHFKRQKNTRESVPLIRQYRDHVEEIRSETVEKALQELHAGKPAADIIETLSRQLANKLMHAPTLQMREINSRDEKK
jgi:glutamyl-tRNA reductase